MSEPAAKIVAYGLGIVALAGIGAGAGVGLKKSFPDHNAAATPSADLITDIKPSDVGNCFGKIRDFVSYQKNTGADGDMPGVRCSIQRNASGGLEGITFSTRPTAKGPQITAHLRELPAGVRIVSADQMMSFSMKPYSASMVNRPEVAIPSSPASTDLKQKEVGIVWNALITAEQTVATYQPPGPQSPKHSPGMKR